MSDNEIQSADLPPAVQRLRANLEDSRRKLLRDKSAGRPTFSDPEQLRQFIAQYLYPEIIATVELFGLAFADSYSTIMSNARDIVTMRRWAVQHFRSLGVNVGDPAGGVSANAVNAVVQEFYVLGSLLEKKLPNDSEIEVQYNNVAAKLSALLAEVQGATGGEDEDDEDDEDDDDEDDEDESAEDGEKSEAAPSAEPEPNKEGGA